MIRMCGSLYKQLVCRRTCQRQEKHAKTEQGEQLTGVCAVSVGCSVCRASDGDGGATEVGVGVDHLGPDD